MYVFETIRTICRELEAHDAEFYLKLELNDEVMRYIQRQRAQNLAEALEILHNLKKTLHKNLLIVQKHTLENIGTAIIRNFEKTKAIEIGYRLNPRFWKQGFATETVDALVAYCQSEYPDKTIVAVTLPQNIASQKVLLKTGFIQKNNIFIDNCSLCYFEYTKK